jgi:hypothetical protein
MAFKSSALRKKEAETMQAITTIGWLIGMVFTARVMYHRWQPGTTQVKRAGKAVFCTYICLCFWPLVGIVLLVMAKTEREKWKE